MLQPRKLLTSSLEATLPFKSLSRDLILLTFHYLGKSAFFSDRNGTCWFFILRFNCFVILAVLLLIRHSSLIVEPESYELTVLFLTMLVTVLISSAHLSLSLVTLRLILGRYFEGIQALSRPRNATFRILVRQI